MTTSSKKHTGEEKGGRDKNVNRAVSIERGWMQKQIGNCDKINKPGSKWWTLVQKKASYKTGKKKLILQSNKE